MIGLLAETPSEENAAAEKRPAVAEQGGNRAAALVKQSS